MKNKNTLEEAIEKEEISRNKKKEIIEKAKFISLVGEIEKYSNILNSVKQCIENKRSKSKQEFSFEDETIYHNLLNYIEKENNTISRLKKQAKKAQRELEGKNKTFRGTTLRYSFFLGALYVSAGHFRENIPFLSGLKDIIETGGEFAETTGMINNTISEHLKGKHNGIKKLEEMLNANEVKAEKIVSLNQKLSDYTKEYEKIGQNFKNYSQKIEIATKKIVKAYEDGETTVKRFDRLQKELEILKNDLGKINHQLEQAASSYSESTEELSEMWYEAFGNFFGGKSKEQLKEEFKHQIKIDDAFKSVYKTMNESKEVIEHITKKVKNLENEILDFKVESNNNFNEYSEKIGKYKESAQAMEKAGKTLQHSYDAEEKLFSKDEKYETAIAKYNQIQNKIQYFNNKQAKDFKRLGEEYEKEGEKISEMLQDFKGIEHKSLNDKEILQKTIKEIRQDYEPLYPQTQGTYLGFIDKFGLMFAIGGFCAYMGGKTLIKAFVPGAGFASDKVKKFFSGLGGAFNRYTMSSKDKYDFESANRIKNNLENTIKYMRDKNDK